MTQLNHQHLGHYPKKPKQVYLFGTCLVDSFFPDSGIDAIELLEQQGIRFYILKGRAVVVSLLIILVTKTRLRRLL